MEVGKQKGAAVGSTSCLKRMSPFHCPSIFSTVINWLGLWIRWGSRKSCTEGTLHAVKSVLMPWGWPLLSSCKLQKVVKSNTSVMTWFVFWFLLVLCLNWRYTKCWISGLQDMVYNLLPHTYPLWRIQLLPCQVHWLSSRGKLNCYGMVYPVLPDGPVLTLLSCKSGVLACQLPSESDVKITSKELVWVRLKLSFLWPNSPQQYSCLKAIWDLRRTLWFWW